MSNQELLDSLSGSEIAIVGMAGRFPGANTPDEFWQNLRDGVESIIPYTDDELRAAGVDDLLLRHPNYVKAGAPLADMEMFDAPFFGFGPQDAAIMDPQHRHFLEVCWEALESAGYDPERFDGLVGVYGGSGHNAYMPYNLLTNPRFVAEVGLFHLRHTGNDKDFLTTRVSFRLNLKGPSINVQTACSTSLVAIHLASLSLLNGECDMALAGGVTIELPHRHGYIYREKEILSPDGHCRAFDADSKGTVFGSGAGAVVLRRLSDAVEAGDHIHAIIRGSAINNDGAGKASYFAPSSDGQFKAITMALNISDVPAETISYIETHGTGTVIGDDIEIKGLTQAFRTQTDKNQFIPIGSVKTNIGHLDTAAGVASIIKTVQAMKHRQLPPSLNFKRHNPEIDFENSPFYVNARLTDWDVPAGIPRRAGVSSLGVGGTNAHVILEEAPVLEPSSPSRPYQLLMLSARSSTALDKMTANLAAHLRQHPQQHLADVAYTLQLGRHPFKNRRVMVVSDHEDAVNVIEASDRQRIFSQSPDRDQSSPKVVFMFPGGGAQYPNMGRDLYETEPLYREIVDECLAILEPQLDFDLRALMFPQDAAVEAAAHTLEQVHSAGLPALFITEYALARLWMSWGIQPATMTGHSMGEYTAACLAGVMSLRDALSIVMVRGKLFETLPEGAMLSIPLPEADVEPLLIGDLNVAVINSPSSCVVSGRVELIEQMEALLQEKGIEPRRVRIAVAAHSAMLEPILAEFHRHVSGVQLNPPTMPYISNLTGTWIRPEDATNPQYWVDHLRRTVRFADGLSELMNHADYLLLEVGPGNTLSSLARQHPDKAAEQVILPSLRHPRESIPDLQYVLTTLGRLWLNGQQVDWQAFYQGELRYRVPLPTYPFDHQRYWIEPGDQVYADQTPEARLAKLPDMADWFYRPSWQRAQPPAPASLEKSRWLVFLDKAGLAGHLVRHLKKDGHEVITVSYERQFTRLGDRAYALNEREREDYYALVEELAENDLLPHKIIHTWALTTPSQSTPAGLEFYRKSRDRVFYSLLFLSQALGSQSLPHRIHLGVVSNGVHQVGSEPLLYPENAILMGPVKVVPREFPDIACHNIDVVLPRPGTFDRLWNPNARQLEQLAEQIIAEFNDEPEASVVAYRGADRWVQGFERAPLEETTDRLREGGVYLITGGLGGIGLAHAEYLAQHYRARLVLLGRSGLPDRENWTHWLATHDVQDKTSRQIRKVQALEAMGAEVLVLKADVMNRQHMRRAIDAAYERFGTLHGVIHAAGVLDDGLISTKTAGATERVLAPKIRGALLLDELLGDKNLDFFVLFSSTSTTLGSPGQVDYTAANAFLDAFAQSKKGANSTHTVAINWGMWRDVGMAAEAAAEAGLTSNPDTGKPADHPLLDKIVMDTPDEIVYKSEYNVRQHWILDQHRLKDGTALIPGTGYLELARAALEKDAPRGTVEIRDLFFIAPLEVKDYEPKEVQVTLNKNGGGYHFTVASKAEADEAWQEHARGKVGYASGGTPPVYAIDDIAARCTVSETFFEAKEQFTQQEQHLNFGPRWKNLRHMKFGVGEAIAALELPEEFVNDLRDYKVHPALMDLATGYGLPLVAGYAGSSDFYVPLSYKRVRINSPLPPRIYSYIRYRADIATPDVPVFDIAILNEEGCALVEVEEFTVKRITNQALFAQKDKKPGKRDKNNRQRGGLNTASSGRPTLLDLGLTEGIGPEEGTEAFRRILAGSHAPRVITTSLDLPKLVEFVNSSAAPEPAGTKFSRPSHLGDYVEPRDEIEKTLARVWGDVLGIEQIGIHDDFFELGGESLVAVRLFAQIKKTFSIELSLATLFQAPTIAQTADLLRGQLTDEAVAQKEGRKTSLRQLSSLVPIQTKGTKPPFYCVHGAGGNVLIFKPLADYLGLDQPFYGFQAQGVDGKQPPLTRIEDMAALYVKELREFQPNGPYYLGGFSMGGEVAFEMAHQLLAAGETVGLLVLFDTFNPDRPIRNPKQLNAESSGSAGAATVTQPGKLTTLRRKAMGHVKRLSAMGPREQLDYIVSDARMRGNRAYLQATFRIAQNTGRSLPYSFLEEYLWECNLKAVYNYLPKVYPGRITLFRAVESLEEHPLDHPMSWGPLAGGGLDVHLIEGTHRLIDEPYVADVVTRLEECLEQAQAEASGWVTY